MRRAPSTSSGQARSTGPGRVCRDTFFGRVRVNPFGGSLSQPQVDGLNAIPGFSCVLPKGAFYAFPNVKGTGLSSRKLQNLLLDEAGVATVSGTAFGAFGEGYLRFSYASSLEQIRAALGRVRALLQPA